MPKQKTHQATAKRFTRTKTDKILHRKSGQDHFNARESGNTLRNKRRDVSTHEVDSKNIKSLMLYK